ncbi:hypothetical protein J8F10_19030 [Gemmata sp. G18]|uniref:Transmembrane protein n=1 Tax=Gemmata palustris TaxID=2822762 RepID=A0ABS5BUE3_9BACT|nr:hypothetical protein [Gemmata palustris]MBP3957344.1 hypothetical protein [Gemmata palustris]
MARIRIFRDEAHGEYFPRLCMRCGRPADHDVPQTFAWMPVWVTFLILLGLGPWIIMALVMRRTMRVVAPMCGKHRGHWRARKLFVWLGLLWWIAVAVALGVFWDALPKAATGPLFIGALFGALIWVIVGMLLANGAIKALEIRDRGIELGNVNKVFAEAWREQIKQLKNSR